MNNETHNEGAVIRSTEFHPQSTVGVAAGLSGTASLFQVGTNFFCIFDSETETLNCNNFCPSRFFQVCTDFHFLQNANLYRKCV